MKAFILSLILFLALISLIIGNAVYVHSACDELSKMLSELESCCNSVKIIASYEKEFKV